MDSRANQTVPARNADLLTGVPAPESNEFYQLFTKILTTLLKTTNLVSVLDHFKADSRRAFDSLIAAPCARRGQDWGVMNPFDFMQRLIYQLTVRATGAREVAEDPKLLESTLRMISEFEGRASHAKIYFPWLPTINYMIQMLNGIKMYMIFDKIIKDRKKSGKTVDDPFQRLMDDGLSVQDTVAVSFWTVRCTINSAVSTLMLSFEIVRDSGTRCWAYQQYNPRGLSTNLLGNELRMESPY
jgi:sterol 14-demethylase